MTSRRNPAAVLAAVVADSGPVVILALIAAAGSFAHIHSTATDHGQTGWKSWAVAICIDLTCVMAARERQRDKHIERATGRITWPTVVLVGGILLSLAANLAQAEPTAWGWVIAATPAVAFLVAVSMLERRATGHRPDVEPIGPPPSWGQPIPATSSRTVPPPLAVEELPALDAHHDDLPGIAPEPSTPAPALLEYARRVAAEHHGQHGEPITRDALRARLGISDQLATDLLHQIKAA